MTRMAALITTGCLKTSGQLAAGRICMVNVLPKDQRAGCAALEEPEYCNPLFGIEQELAGQSPEERYEQPLAPSKPVMDALLVWAEMKSAAAPKSALGRALYYLREQWPYLIRFLEDGRLEISNNGVERSVKPFVMGRKNWLFANTEGGAQSSAMIYSLIETAKENGLAPYCYFIHVLTEAPGLAAKAVVGQRLFCTCLMRCWMHCPDTFSQRGCGLATPTLLYYAFLLDVCNHFYGKTTPPPPISRGFQDNQWQGQKDSNPRHAVLGGCGYLHFI